MDQPATLARLIAALIQMGCAFLAARLVLADRKRWGWGLFAFAILMVVAHGFYRENARFLIEVMGVVFSLVLLLAMLEIRVVETDLKQALEKYAGDFRSVLFGASRIPMAVLDGEAGTFLDCNDAYLRVSGFEGRESLLGRTLTSLAPEHQPCGTASSLLAEGYLKNCIEKGSEIFAWRMNRGREESWDGEIQLMPFQHRGKNLIQAVFQDITEARRMVSENVQDQIRLRSLMRLHERSYEREETLIEQMLQDALELTDSHFAHLYFLDDQNGVIQKSYGCSTGKDDFGPLAESGLHLEAAVLSVLRAQPREFMGDAWIVNHPDSSLPWPQGLGKVTRHLGLPIWDGDRIVLYIGVGNKLQDYKEQDGRQLRFFVGGFWNMLRRKRAEENVKKLSLAVEQSPVSIIITDTSGTIEYVNAAFTKITGYSSAEILGKNPRLLKSGHFSSDQYAEMFSCLYSGKVWQGIFHNKKKDGSHFWEKASIAPIKDATGKITHFLAVKLDITELNAVREMLNEAEDRWRFALESAGDGLWDWDIEKGEIYHSKRWKEMMGDGPDAEDGTLEGWRSRVHPDDVENAEKALQQHLKNELPAYISEYRIRRRDGQYIWIQDRGKVVKRSEDGRPLRMMGTQADISERRRSDELLGNVRQLESLAVLAGGLAHDFNNIFTGALGNLDIAESMLMESAPERRQLGNVREALLRASNLSRQMLAFSGRGRFDFGLLDLNHLLREWHESLSVLVGADIALEISYADVQPMFEGDVRQIRQVVDCLLVNAAEAMAGKSGTIRISIGFEMVQERPRGSLFFGQDFEAGLHATLRVEDQGCGMDHETLPRIFEPFFSTKFAGRGLSLAVAQGILRAHDGGVRVESVHGKGSVFTLYFPAPTVSLEPQKPADAAEVQLDYLVKAKGRAILLVDDEEMLREAIADLLRSSGYEVLEAEDGQAGVECYRENQDRIGLVLMDLTMPRMDGRTAFLAIKDIDPDARIVLSSGYSEHEVMRSLKDKGLSGFLAKPYQFKEVAELVGKMLA